MCVRPFLNLLTQKESFFFNFKRYKSITLTYHMYLIDLTHLFLIQN